MFRENGDILSTNLGGVAAMPPDKRGTRSRPRTEIMNGDGGRKRATLSRLGAAVRKKKKKEKRKKFQMGAEKRRRRPFSPRAAVRG